MTVGDRVELAGLVVALVVGIPAAVAAIIMIRNHMNSRHKRSIGEICPSSIVCVTGVWLGMSCLYEEVSQSLLLVSNLQVMMRHVISAFWLSCTQLTAWTIVAGSWHRRADVRSMDEEALDGRPAMIVQGSMISLHYRRYICDEPARYLYASRDSRSTCCSACRMLSSVAQSCSVEPHSAMSMRA